MRVLPFLQQIKIAKVYLLPFHTFPLQNPVHAIDSYASSFSGYGTSFGTRFPGGIGAYGGSGFSRKRLGLGVGAGFLGGAMTGMAMMSIYHRLLYNSIRTFSLLFDILMKLGRR